MNEEDGSILFDVMTHLIITEEIDEQVFSLLLVVSLILFPDCLTLVRKTNPQALEILGKKGSLLSLAAMYAPRCLATHWN